MFGGGDKTGANQPSGSGFGTGAPGTSLFGATPAAGSTPTNNMFGVPSTNNGGLFGGGGSAPPSSSLFGSKPPNTTEATTGGLFGASKPAVSPAPTLTAATGAATADGGLFGAKPAAATNTSSTGSGGLFGAKPAAATNTSSTESGGLFGAKPAAATNTSSTGSGGLFGAKPAAATNTSSTGSGGLFGTKPAAASDASAPGSGGLFGAKPAAAGDASAPGSGGLFGTKPAAGDASAPGSKPVESNPAETKPVGAGLFGASKPTETPVTTGVIAAASPPAPLAPRTGLEAYAYERLDHVVRKLESEYTGHCKELEGTFKKLQSVESLISERHAQLVNILRKQDEEMCALNDFIQSTYAIHEEQRRSYETLCRFVNDATNQISEHLTSDAQSMRILTEGSTSAALQDHFRSLTDTIENAEKRAHDLDGRLSACLERQAHQQGLGIIIDAVNTHISTLEELGHEVRKSVTKEARLRE